jgi:Na+-transporting methylmalonyl-CoA/oxaloacetate decarboxylase gamma subunit
MVNPFINFLTRLHEFGFFNFFVPWLIFTAVFYALLKKSKLFGESDLINGTVALAVSFFIMYFPIMSGIELAPILSRFVMQSAVFFLIFIFAYIGASVLYPDLTALMKEKMTSRAWLMIFVVLMILIFITSGMLDVFVKGFVEAGVATEEQKDIYTIVTALILLAVLLLIATAVAQIARIRLGV